jgi:hypothetical protein
MMTDESAQAGEERVHASAIVDPHKRRREILNRSPLHRACNRGVHASVAFFLVEGRLRQGVRISPGACLPRALLPHARHLLPPVTGVLSDQFVMGGEVDFPAQVGDRHCGRRAGAAISGFAPRRR